MKEKLQASYNGTITTAQVDADNPEELIALIEREKPDVVLNLHFHIRILQLWMPALRQEWIM